MILSALAFSICLCADQDSTQPLKKAGSYPKTERLDTARVASNQTCWAGFPIVYFIFFFFLKSTAQDSIIKHVVSAFAFSVCLSADQDVKEYTTRDGSRLIPQDREIFTESHLTKLAELNPPDLMPNGNVGTPTSVFLEYIRTCRLPPRVIQKLGLTFSKGRTNRRYGNVQFAYGGETVEGQSEEDEIALTASGHEIIDESSKFAGSRRTGSGASTAGGKKQRKAAHGKTENPEEEKREQESESDEVSLSVVSELWQPPYMYDVPVVC